MATYIKQNLSHPLIVVLLDNKGDYKTGQTITYEVHKSSDNTLTTSGTLTSTGNIYTDFITISVLGEHYILYFTPTKHENGLENVIVRANTVDDIAIDLDALAIKLTKVLGLVQSNYRLTDQIYDVNGCLTSAKISIYNNASDTNSQTNPITEYTINATYNANDELTDYKVTEN